MRTNPKPPRPLAGRNPTARQGPRPLTTSRAGNLPNVGRSAAQGEPQQSITSDGPPFNATKHTGTKIRAPAAPGYSYRVPTEKSVGGHR
ncbi:Flagellar hook-associated protein flgK [Arthrobacter sp. 9V]|nr:Flagellar hook-associated protein flgK [Arthrobacter sp. 9V]